MMTWKEWMLDYLIENGMWDDEAERVIALAIEGSLEHMEDRLDDSTEGYPPQLYPAVALVLNEYALVWIDKNAPKAFYRQVFEANKQELGDKMFDSLKAANESLPFTTRCHECDGSGYCQQYGGDCRGCNGTGTVQGE
jgi:hypothetical protein